MKCPHPGVGRLDYVSILGDVAVEVDQSEEVETQWRSESTQKPATFQIIFKLYSNYIQIIFKLYSIYIQIIFVLYFKNIDLEITEACNVSNNINLKLTSILKYSKYY